MTELLRDIIKANEDGRETSFYKEPKYILKINEQNSFFK